MCCCCQVHTHTVLLLRGVLRLLLFPFCCLFLFLIIAIPAAICCLMLERGNKIILGHFYVQCVCACVLHPLFMMMRRGYRRGGAEEEMVLRNGDLANVLNVLRFTSGY